LGAQLSIESELERGTRVTIAVPARVAEVETMADAEEGRKQLLTVAARMKEDNRRLPETVAYGQSAAG
jgi:hypothetical protein